MAELYSILKPENTYYDRKNVGVGKDYQNVGEYFAALDVSTTVYVGNLSFYTSQDSIRELFSYAGKVTNIIMGINEEGHPCGFCFVVFQTHEEAGKAVEFISKTKLNDRVIRVDWDPGYKEGREKGRGTGGQQRREDFRTKEDAERPRKKPERERFERGNRPERERTRERDYHGDRDYRRRDRQQQRHRTRERPQQEEGY